MTDREFFYSLSVRAMVLTISTYFIPRDSRWKRIFAKALTRPFQLFAQESIIQILGIYMAFLYGLFYRMS